MIPTRRLTLFTRSPAPGEAKTRLVPPLTPDQAAALQRAMTEDLLDRLAPDLARATDLELRLAESAANPAPLPLTAPPEWRTVPQGEGDLGVRLRRAVHDAGAQSVSRLALIGADAPLLPTGLIESAFAALDHADVALAPAEDGGYVLLALATRKADPNGMERRSPPVLPASSSGGGGVRHRDPHALGDLTRFDALFDAIPWGTPEVTAATRAAAHAAGLTVHLLPTHWDVDRPADLTRLTHAIRRLPGATHAQRTESVLRDVGATLRGNPVHKPMP